MGFKEYLMGLNEGKKQYEIRDGIGASKYTVSSHDGNKKHKDGSDFWDIDIFKNKIDRDNYIKKLKSDGYTER